MKYIAIFEDRKGFTRIIDFPMLPPTYDFIEYEPIKVTAIHQSNIDADSPLNKRLTFYPKGEPQEIYGCIIQKYYQY